MFTIDLLKGKGLPPKSRPIVVALMTAPFMIPVFGAVVMAACWQHNRMLIDTRQKIVCENKSKIAVLQEVLDSYSQKTEQISLIQQELHDVSKMLIYRIQMSDVMAEVVKRMPDSLVATRMEWQRQDSRIKKDDGSTELRVSRKLQLKVGGVDNPELDLAAEQYVKNLGQSELLGTVFGKIKITSRENCELDGKNCAFYEIECNLIDTQLNGNKN